MVPALCAVEGGGVEASAADRGFSQAHTYVHFMSVHSLLCLPFLLSESFLSDSLFSGHYKQSPSLLASQEAAWVP